MAEMHFSGATTISRALYPEWEMKEDTGRNLPKCLRQRST